MKNCGSSTRLRKRQPRQPRLHRRRGCVASPSPRRARLSSTATLTCLSTPLPRRARGSWSTSCRRPPAPTSPAPLPGLAPSRTTRGPIRNGTRRADNPTLIQRDRRYSARGNPVSFANDVGGITLFGDKTGLSASSSFDRINVRRLFIYIEGAIEAAANDQLF